jgi:hypothetical protein
MPSKAPVLAALVFGRRPERRNEWLQPRRRNVAHVLTAMVAVLLAASVLESYVWGQHQIMYDNPIYRWRESMAITLSRMQEKPLHGYVAYRSIWDHLAKNGLGLMAGEVAIYSGLTLPRRKDIRPWLPVLVYIAAFSTIPTRVVARGLTIDTFLFYVLLVLMYAICMHVVAFRRERRAPTNPLDPCRLRTDSTYQASMGKLVQ